MAQTILVRNHVPSGELYILQYTGERVTGVVGPLYHADLPVFLADLESVSFSSEDADWANEQGWSFPR